MTLGMLTDSSYQPTESPVANAPSWSVWSCNNTKLPVSALTDASHPDSALSWLSTKPHLQQVSRSSAEHVFLAIGLILYNFSGDDDKQLWINMAQSISVDIQNSAQYQYVQFMKYVFCIHSVMFQDAVQ